MNSQKKEEVKNMYTVKFSNGEVKTAKTLGEAKILVLKRANIHLGAVISHIVRKQLITDWIILPH